MLHGVANIVWAFRALVWLEALELTSTYNSHIRVPTTWFWRFETFFYIHISEHVQTLHSAILKQDLLPWELTELLDIRNWMQGLVHLLSMFTWLSISKTVVYQHDRLCLSHSYLKQLCLIHLRTIYSLYFLPVYMLWHSRVVCAQNAFLSPLEEHYILCAHCGFFQSSIQKLPLKWIHSNNTFEIFTLFVVFL